MESLHQRLSPHAEVRDLVELSVEDTLQYDPYKDKLKNAKTLPFLNEEPEVTPEWRDQYVNEEILFLRGDKMPRGCMICQKHDADGNPIGRSNQNPILDTCLYEVEFPQGEMTELTANIIAESMYAQCDVIEMNIYYWRHPLIIESMVHLSVEDQRIVVRG